MRYDKRLSSCVLIIPNRNPHICLFSTIRTDGHAGLEGDIYESSIPIVAIEIIWLAIICHEEIEPPVIVKVRPEGCEAKEVLRIVDSGSFRYICKGSVAVVVI